MAKKTKSSDSKGTADAPSLASFEKTLAELEEIVQQLEEGDKPLDQSIALYERGVRALKTCHAVLDQAEQRIKTLVKDAGGKPALKDSAPGRGAEDDDGEVEEDDAGGEDGEDGEEEESLFGQ